MMKRGDFLPSGLAQPSFHLLNPQRKIPSNTPENSTNRGSHGGALYLKTDFYRSPKWLLREYQGLKGDD